MCTKDERGICANGRRNQPQPPETPHPKMISRLPPNAKSHINKKRKRERRHARSYQMKNVVWGYPPSQPTGFPSQKVKENIPRNAESKRPRRDT